LASSAKDSPLALRIYLILSLEMIKPCNFTSMLKAIDTDYIFFAEGVVVSIVFTNVLRAKLYPYSKLISSLYYCFKNEFAATWLLPIAVAFHNA